MRASSWPRLSFVLLVGLGLISGFGRTAQAEAPPDSVAAVVSQVKQAVVEIVVVRAAKKTEGEPSDPQVAQASGSLGSRATTVGSGFIIDRTGFVATNKHVVENAVSVVVVTSDGVRYKARIVGVPPKVDIALLKIDAGKDLPVVPFGNSDKVRVGDAVIAIGSPFGFNDSVSAGIVSAVDRDIMESPFDDYIQTDATINHGNSGGPLFNLAGEVIGMNSVLFAPGENSGSVGLGFAIPSNELRFVIDRLMINGKVGAGMLPIRTQQVNWMIQQAIGAPGLQGALITALGTGGNAMMGGQIKPGDVVVSFNGETILDPRGLARMAARSAVGSDVTLGIWRGGVPQIAHVKIQAWPDVDPPAISQQKPRTLGLQLAIAPAPQSGVMVAAVDPSGSAADSGIEKGDVILQVQQETVSDPDRVLRILQTLSDAKHGFAALLVERSAKVGWIGIAVPD